MPKQKVEIEIDVPEGYEYTGEYRCPIEGEPNTIKGSDIRVGGKGYNTIAFILRKKELTGWEWLRTLPNNTLVEHASIVFLVQRNESHTLCIVNSNDESKEDYRAFYHMPVSDFSPSTCEILYPKEGE